MTSSRPKCRRASAIAERAAWASVTSRPIGWMRSPYSARSSSSCAGRRAVAATRSPASGEAWQEWSGALRAELGMLTNPTPAAVAAVFAGTLAARGAFCDLLAQAPLNLERNVSVDAVRAFKLVTHTELDAIALVVRRLLPALSGRAAVDLIAAATSLSGAFWQMATPGPEIAALYRSDPRLAHAVFDVEARVQRLLTALIQGLLAPT